MFNDGFVLRRGDGFVLRWGDDSVFRFNDFRFPRPSRFGRNNNFLMVIFRRVILLDSCLDELGDRLLSPSTVNLNCNYISRLLIAHLLHKCYDCGAITEPPDITTCLGDSSIEAHILTCSLKWVPEVF
jgi:hypothetical protein